MHPASNPRHLADQILLVDRMLRRFASGDMPMHPADYRELARWVTRSFRSMDSDTLRTMLEVAPVELREIVENVLHERRVISWAANDLVGLSSLSETMALLQRCRRRRRRKSA